jgi:hypothetical protein
VLCVWGGGLEEGRGMWVSMDGGGEGGVPVSE